MQKRKTYTSSAVKRRYNLKHYDSVQFVVPKGALAEIKAIAAAKDISLAAYIRNLIIADNADKPQDIAILSGGGVLKAPD